MKLSDKHLKLKKITDTEPLIDSKKVNYLLEYPEYVNTPDTVLFSK